MGKLMFILNTIVLIVLSIFLLRGLFDNDIDKNQFIVALFIWLFIFGNVRVLFKEINWY